METLELKTCSKCKIEQSPDNFYKDKSKKDGFARLCKTCKSDEDKKYREQNIDAIKQQRNEYYEENKDTFRQRSKKYRDENADSLKVIAKKYREENKDTIRQRGKQYYEENKDKFQQYREENKEEKKQYMKKYREENKDAIKQKTKQYRENNADETKRYMEQYRIENADALSQYGKQYKKKYYDKNREIILEKAKQYQIENKDKRKQYLRENADAINLQQRDRRRTDIQHRIKKVLRGRLKSAVRNGAKVGSAVQDMGCSVEFLKNHLESQFTEGMAWENWGFGPGNWNIDHIVPLSIFNLEDRQHVILACHYGNLQPLWFENNMYKSDTVPTWENYRTIHLYDKIAA